MAELAMCIPLIAFIIAMTFFFGFSMANQQHVRISDRYAAWRRVLTGTMASDEQLNEMFFADRAGEVQTDTDTGPVETLEDLVAEAGDVSEPAHLLAERCVLERWPRGRRVKVQADFPSSVGAWRRFTGAIRSRHVRDGVQWRRGQASCDYVVCDEFLSPLDDVLAGVSAPGDGLAEMMRQLYSNGW